MSIWAWPPRSDTSFWRPYERGVWGKYTLTESNQIVRIPVAGPPPFNTLVVVRGFFPDQALFSFPTPPDRISAADGRMHGQAFQVRTPFKLAGFSSSTPMPDFKHSTTAALRHRVLRPEAAFTTAVNKISGYFDHEGRWMLHVETAFLVDNSNAAAHFHFSSFILCNEPWGGFGSDPIEQPVWPDP